ncbi:MAG TPA: amino acid adenylation domain-containing protein [Candidatus Deferrimicrobium sp.]|nr:amino acid adenylation domain-containing protein [Candidatus Deferrimicrobium sp.]
MKKIIAPLNDFAEFKIEDIEQSIPSRFEQQVKKYPGQTAVKTKNTQADYETLNRLANRIAHAILTQTKNDENVIALLMEQGIPLIASILAVLKTGKIYVPLNPGYPLERNSYILNDSGAGLIVTNTRNTPLAGSLAGGIRLLNVDEIADSVAPGNLELPISPDTPACILYTSGSTGQPKGVLDNHRNVLHNMMIYTNGLHISHEDHMTIFHSCSFGASRLDMYGALLNGAALHLRDMEEEGFSGMAGWLAQEKITLYHSTPTVFRHFISTLNGSETFPGMRIVHLGSEPVQLNDIALYKKHFHPGCLFLNRFGTTETGTVRLFFSNHETEFQGGSAPAGYAVHGMDILIRDDTGRQVKAGDTGEIAIKSRYLSQGYWRKPDLTQAVFLDDPVDAGERIYKTGDLGRILPDGCLVILGRKDSQVKIKGFRVEIPEIETALLKLGLFREAVVVPLKDRFENSYLAAYLVPAGETALNVSRLREELKKTLPEYMVPSAFVALKALPRTPNDKIDRKALPEPGKVRPELGVDYTVPQGDLEQLIVTTWEEVLQIEGIGTHDHFFDLGGSSLLMNIVHARLQEALGITISLIEMYEYPTVNALAGYLELLKE